MKVWITKYALTDGIIEADANPVLCGSVCISDIISPVLCRILNEGEWHSDKKQAIDKAEEMRQKKIESLKKQIDKLERMRFE